MDWLNDLRIIAINNFASYNEKDTVEVIKDLSDKIL